MRLFTLVLTLFVSLLFIANVAALSFNVEMDQATLQDGLSRAFPVQRDEAFVSVKLSQPQVMLKEGSDRIGLRTTTTVSFPVNNTISGNAYIDGKPRYDQKTNAFYLQEATVHEMNIGGLPDSVRQEVLRIATVLIRSFLDKQPLYVFRDDNPAISMIKKQISRVEVRNGKLVVEVSSF